ncbi:MAG: hypothetical protein ABJG15_14555 [Hyphomonadaceae bacterium]
MVWRVLKFIFMLPLFGIIAIIATSCTQFGLNYASLETDNKPVAMPALVATGQTDWQTREAPELKAKLEQSIFGPVPTGVASRIVSQRIVDDRYLGGRGVLEEFVVELGTGTERVQFHLALATPKVPLGPAPLIIGQTFCDNMGVFEHADLSPPMRGRSCGMSENRSALGSAFMYIFGEYINKAPMADYLERGFAYANFFAAEIVPDAQGAGREALQTFPKGADGRRASGAVAAWAAGYFAAIDLLAGDTRIDGDKIAVFGHSRHGKSALVAGAWDARIKAVISHQSGTLGASLSRDKPGETVKHILNGHSFGDGYPHWFAPEFLAFADDVDALPVDQHMLIALNAPRRVLLGNGRRDVWSDPNGAYRAAEGASAAWQLFGQDGLKQDGMKAFNPEAGIAYHLRPGGHGIVRADVDAFLAFLEASFAQE